MTRPCLRAFRHLFPLLPLSLFGGCAETAPVEEPLPGAPASTRPAPPGAAPGAVSDAPPAGGPATGIKAIMVTLTKGPNSLTPVLGKELAADPLPWETVQPQAKEYARLAAELGTFDPPKGDKDSWARLTASYAKSAADLDKAAQARDKDAALAAHSQLANSCMSCHRAHRVMGPGGRGGPGGPGGPPPGGPGGPPPG